MKNSNFYFRLSDKEYAQLEKKAKQAGLGKSSLLRKYINEEMPMDIELQEQLQNLMVGLGRIGNNINQIARKWNESGSDYRDIAFLREQMDELYTCFGEVRAYCHSAYRGKRE